MTNPVTAVELARYDTRERGLRTATRPIHRWRARTGLLLEAWGRRLRAADVAGSRGVGAMTRVPTARVTPVGAR